MPKKKTAARRWLGCFTVQTPDKETEGSFQMLVDAASIDTAVRRFEERLKDLHARTTLFHTGGAVFLEYVLDVSKGRSVPALLNYVSGTKPPDRPVIYCGVPEQPDIDVATYGLSEEESEVDMHPLVSFRPKNTPRGSRASH